MKQVTLLKCVTLLFMTSASGCAFIPKEPTKSVRAKVRVKPKPRPRPVKAVFTTAPIKKEKAFIPTCLSMMGGCKEIQSIKKKQALLESMLETRTAEFTDALSDYFEALSTDEKSPAAAVSYKFSKEPKDWKSLDEDIKTKATIKIRYGKLSERIGEQSLTKLIKLQNRLVDLDTKWKKFRKYSTTALTLAKSKGNTYTTGVKVIYLPSNIVPMIPDIKSTTKKLFAALVNNKHGLTHHILNEYEIVLENFFTFDRKNLKLSFNFKAKTVLNYVVFDTPLLEVCDALRVELRLEDGKRLRRVRKPLPINDQDQAKKSLQAKGNSDSTSKESILDQIVAALTAPNPKRPATLVDGKWRLPPLSEARKNYMLTKIFKEFTPVAPLEQKLCIREKGVVLFEMRTSEKSMPSVLGQMGISPSILVPEETLRYKYTFQDAEKKGFAEPEDLGRSLFDALKKKKNAVLKMNMRFKEIPYKIKLNTDTGRKITLPVFVDGLQSKRVLSKKARWRLLGLSKRFDILSAPTHSLFLAEVARAGLVQISNIKYNKIYRDVTIPWTKTHHYEISLSGERANWLGQVRVTTSAKLWVHKDKACDLAIDIETKEDNQNLFIAQGDERVLDAVYQAPGLKYVLGYSDPPNCQ